MLRSPDERRLAHINALSFAKEHRISESEAIDLFLHAAKLGLVEIEWRVLCPACGISIESFSSLRQVDHRLYCEVCHEPMQVNLDDFIQVAFTVSPRVRPLACHDPATMPAREQVFGCRFATEALLPDGNGQMRDVMAAMCAVCEHVEQRSVLTLELELVEGLISACDLASHADFTVQVSGEPAGAPQRLVASIERGRFTLSSLRLAPGRLTLELHNDSDRRATVLAANVPKAQLEAPAPAPTKFGPFLTGGRVLAQNTFRRLFRSEVIQASEGIGLPEQTVLFTDLKSSTALYEKIGALPAFELVRQHFERLAEVVQAFDGAVVKTIGDAVMAVFHDPARALGAAAQMLEVIDTFNLEHGSHDLMLKIGLHRGPSIAVTMNENVDYFGQTVNVAARVQGLAEGGEICCTWIAHRSVSVIGSIS